MGRPAQCRGGKIGARSDPGILTLAALVERFENEHPGLALRVLGYPASWIHTRGELDTLRAAAPRKENARA